MKLVGLAPLRQTGYRLYWASSVFWGFGRWIDALASGWLALQLTNSAWLVALIGFYRAAPLPICGVLAGAIADRVERRTLVVASEVANVVTTLGLTWLLLAGRLEYWHLAVANVILGAAWSVEWPARRVLIADLVESDQVVPAVALDTLSTNATKALGPLLGGGLIAALGAQGCYALVTCLYVGALVPIVALRPPSGGRPVATAPVLRFLAEGFSFCRDHPVIRGVLLVAVAVNLFAYPYEQLLSVFARDVLEVGPLGLGVLSAGLGIGSLIGTSALVAARPERSGLLFLVGSLGMCLGIGLFGPSPLFALSLALLILAGIGQTGYSTFGSAIVLDVAGASMRGRAMGVLSLAMGSWPLGMLLVGGLAAALGAPLAVGLTGVAGTLMVASTIAATPELVGFRSRVALAVTQSGLGSTATAETPPAPRPS